MLIGGQPRAAAIFISEKELPVHIGYVAGLITTVLEVRVKVNSTCLIDLSRYSVISHGTTCYDNFPALSWCD
jgi:hypothetical protein